MAITTIVFDMGGVLVDFDAKRSLTTHFAPEYHELINEKTFASHTWKLMDKGDFEVEEAIEIMCRDLPADFHEEVSKMILDHEGEMPPIEEMYSIVKTLKENGYKIYLLSIGLRRPIYQQTAAYGHMGRTDIDLPWEKTDKVDELKAAL